MYFVQLNFKNLNSKATLNTQVGLKIDFKSIQLQKKTLTSSTEDNKEDKVGEEEDKRNAMSGALYPFTQEAAAVATLDEAVACWEKSVSDLQHEDLSLKRGMVEGMMMCAKLYRLSGRVCAKIMWTDLRMRTVSYLVFLCPLGKRTYVLLLHMSVSWYVGLPNLVK